MKTFNKKEDAPNNPFHLRIWGKYKKETERAMCFDFDGASVWLPKSQMFCIDNGISDITYYVARWYLVNSKVRVS